MRYSKVLKLGAVGLALLLIPRRSSRDVKAKGSIAPDLTPDTDSKGQLKGDAKSDDNDSSLDE